MLAVVEYGRKIPGIHFQLYCVFEPFYNKKLGGGIKHNEWMYLKKNYELFVTSVFIFEIFIKTSLM